MEPAAYLHRAELFALGHTRRSLDLALATGSLIRARRDHYLVADVRDEIVRAVRVGGRLTCLSLLALMRVFVLHTEHLHVHMERTSSRMRSPHDRAVRLEPRPTRGVRLHWLPLATTVGAAATVDVIDALAHAVLCQTPRAAVASLDSALHLGIIRKHELADVFRLLPARYGVLAGMVDPRAESGPETLMRLMLRGLGCDIQLQVKIAGVGRVDLVVDGWLVIECDSEAHHGGWAAQERDRRRDLQLAARGYSSLRPTAKMIIHEPDLVLDAVRGMLATRR